MNWKKYFVALFSCFFVVVIFDILWNAVLFREVYVRAEQYWLPVEQLNRLVPVGFLIMLVIMALMGFIFIRFGASGVRQGLEFGLLMGLTTLVGTLAFATMVPWPFILICAMAFQNFVNNLLTGLFFGWLYRPKAFGQ